MESLVKKNNVYKMCAYKTQSAKRTIFEILRSAVQFSVVQLLSLLLFYENGNVVRSPDRRVYVTESETILSETTTTQSNIIAYLVAMFRRPPQKKRYVYEIDLLFLIFINI